MIIFFVGCEAAVAGYASKKTVFTKPLTHVDGQISPDKWHPAVACWRLQS